MGYSRTMMCRYGIIVIMTLIFIFFFYQFNQSYREKRIEVSYQLRGFQEKYQENRTRMVETFLKKKDELRKRFDQDLKEIYFNEQEVVDAMDQRFQTEQKVKNSTLYILQQTFPDLFYRCFSSDEDEE